MLQTKVASVHASDALLDYVQAVVKFTRDSPLFETGLSPRAAIALLRAAQAWALMHGHSGVLPEDLQAVLSAVVGHRLAPREASTFKNPKEIGDKVLKAVAVP
jgi:MoxR-like ATPase